MIHLNKENIPIPELRSVKGWKEVDINDNNEELVSVKNRHDRITVFPHYYNAEIIGSIDDILVRESVSDMLISALEYLPENWRFIVYDGYRPYEVQLSLYNNHFNILKNKHKELPEHEIKSMTEIYVSYPSTKYSCPSPHLTGGSVDLSIIDESNNTVSMGSDFDQFSGRSCTNFFEKKLLKDGDLSEAEYVFLYNRRILFHALTSVGFSNYSEEWWHFDYGNQFWAVVEKKTAIYNLYEYN